MMRNLQRRHTLVVALAAFLLAPATALAGDAAAGKAVYDINCIACHGPTGKGDGPVGVALPPPPPRDFSVGDFKFDADGDGTTGTDADLSAVIQNGAAKFGGSPLMAPWAHLSAEDIGHLIAFIRSLKQ